jgi:hypothetical protein
MHITWHPKMRLLHTAAPLATKSAAVSATQLRGNKPAHIHCSNAPRYNGCTELRLNVLDEYVVNVCCPTRALVAD